MSLQRVTVWLARRPASIADELLTHYRATLSADELARAARYNPTDGGDGFTWSRGLQRAILAHHLGAAPGALRFEQNGDGKPRLASPGDVACEYNASHSGDLFALAVSDRPVGLDVERTRAVRGLEKAARRVFDPTTFEAIVASTDPLTAFLTQWTRLEAHSKLHGHGVWKLLAEREAHAAAEGVRVASLALPDGYFGAVAVARAEPEVVLRWWSD